MKIKPIYLFEENDVVKIEKLTVNEENGENHQSLGLKKGAEALILWKSGKKIILKIGKNKLAIVERTAIKILASLV